MVIGADTLTVYGHVTASNPLGEVYVSPLRDTINEIQTYMGRDVTLRRPTQIAARAIPLGPLSQGGVVVKTALLYMLVRSWDGLDELAKRFWIGLADNGTLRRETMYHPIIPMGYLAYVSIYIMPL